jgi:hypothetical protein
MPIFAILILLAISSGCTSWTYPDKTVQRAMQYETPANSEPGVMHGSSALSTYGQ